VSLSDQGLVQVLEASVTGLEPGKPYVVALSSEASGGGVLEPLQGFMTNPAGCRRQRDRTDPAARARSEQSAIPLSGDRARYGRKPRRCSASTHTITTPAWSLQGLRK
jgi:hypothetical protein